MTSLSPSITESRTRAKKDATDEKRPDVTRKLRDAAVKAHSQQAFYHEAARIIAAHFDSPFALIHADLASGALKKAIGSGNEADSSWQKICEQISLDVRFRGRAVAKMYSSSGLGQAFAVLGVPMVDERIVGGSLVTVTACESLPLANARLRELQSLQGQISLLVSQAVPDVRIEENQEAQTEILKRTSTVRALSTIANYESIRELSFAIANDVKSKVGCEQVCLGIVDESRVQVMAVSGQSDINLRGPGVRLIADAMAECLDAEKIVSYPSKHDDGNYFLHRRWCQESGHTTVATIPMSIDNRTAAIISLRHLPGKGFDVAGLVEIQKRIQPLVPGMLLLSQASESPLKRLWKTGQQNCQLWMTKGRGAFGVCAVALLAWFLFGTATYRITVPCTITSQQIRHFAAPLQGTLSQSTVELGQIVKAGDVLAEFDVQPLLLLREQLLAELKSAEMRMNRAILAKAPEAAEIQNEMLVVEAKLKQVETQANQSVLRAPFDGIVTAGELRKRIGEVFTVGEPMVTIAANDELELLARVPESFAPVVAGGQTGTFIAQARPEAKFPIRIAQVDSSSQVDANETVYQIAADFETQESWMRFGMTGYASINTEKKPIWWIATHKFASYLRIQLWKL